MPAKRDREKRELATPSPKIARPKTSMFSRPGPREQMFTPGSVEVHASEFDYMKEGDRLLRTQNQELYAIRAQISKNQKKGPQLARPVTAFSRTAGMSLLSKRKVDPMKGVDFSGVQTLRREIEGERNSISFREDPIAYFSKRKDGRGHRFIYMNHVDQKGDVNFSPYKVVKVPFAEVNEEYFTMSANGITHVFPDGVTEHIALHQWTRDSTVYAAIRKLKAFRLFLYWKPLRIWRKFVKRQRYRETAKVVITVIPFHSYPFAKATGNIMNCSFDKMMTTYLLCFAPQRKYMMNAFKQLVVSNWETLKELFAVYLEDTMGHVLELDADIRDPQRVVVKNTEFTEGKRYMPRLGEIMILEEKKAAEKKKRTELVQNEVCAFVAFIRMIDYSILENLMRCCLDCWRTADRSISQEMSAIFEIDILFTDDGDILFEPSPEELLKQVVAALHGSVRTLDKLPRALMSTSIRPHLHEVVVNLTSMFETGPTFKAFFETNKEFTEIEDHIIKVISDNFEIAKAQSNQYKEYFRIYQIGKFWDPQDYLKERGGESHLFALTASFNGKEQEDVTVSYDPSTEVIVDFDAVERDIERFCEDKASLAKFRACTICGPLYVDSRKLRALLTPIPAESLLRVQQALSELMMQKVSNLTNILRIAIRRLKKDPRTLDSFVDFCYFLNKAEEATTWLANEVKFVDCLYGLLERAGLTSTISIDASNIPIFHDTFTAFIQEKVTAAGIKSRNLDHFSAKLAAILREKERKLLKYRARFQTFPDKLSELDSTYLLTMTRKTRQKIDAMAPEIEELLLCQEILGKKANDFTIFKQVLEDANYQEWLYHTVSIWMNLDAQISTVPFTSFDIPQLKADIGRVESEIHGPRGERHNPILSELADKLCTVSPFLEQMEQLANGKMQLHHWNKLFEECGHPNTYYGQIKIDELIALGILKEKDKIAIITSTAQGESQLEAEFHDVSVHWKHVKIPVTSRSDDNILIGDIKPVINEIIDAQVTLKRMLQIPYVQGIKENILALSGKLEGFACVLEAWYIFQKNWLLVAPIFALDDIRTVLANIYTRFGIVKRRWTSVVRHAATDMTLFHICSFPTLFEMLKENNNTLEAILAALHKYFDAKRALVPRLYFLSDDEMVKILGTSDFTVLNMYVSKLFMDISAMDSRAQDLKESRAVSAAQNFQRVRISGLIADNGDTLVFSKPVQCVGAFETWIKQVIDAMHVSMKEAVVSAVRSCSTMKLGKWLESVPLSVGITALYIIFASDIQECFNNFENNIRSFLDYETKISAKIAALTAQLSFDLTAIQHRKIACALSVLVEHRDQTTALSERSMDFSQPYNWKYMWKLGLTAGRNPDVSVSLGNMTTTHGHEFYGTMRPYVITEASMRTLTNLAYAVLDDQPVLLNGGSASGRYHTLKYLGMLFGRPVFGCKTDIDGVTVNMIRELRGSIGIGAWLVLRNAEDRSYDQMCCLYDILDDLMITKKLGHDNADIGGVQVRINKFHRLFVIAGSEYVQSSDIPPHFRALLKPIGLAAPDMVRMAGIALMTHGMSYWQILGEKLVNSVSEIQRSFVYLKEKSLTGKMFLIAREAYVLIGELCSWNSDGFLNYNTNPQCCEEFCVVLTAYRTFTPFIREKHHVILRQILFANFMVAANFDKFTEMLAERREFRFETAVANLKKLVTDEIETVEMGLPVDYMISKVLDLSNMLDKYQIVVIAGDANTGKTSVVDILSRVAVAREDPPWKILDLYHESDVQLNIFGASVQGDEAMFYGQIQSYCFDLFAEENVTRVLRFNGPITPRFVKRITHMISQGLLTLGTFDSFAMDSSFRIIIETDSIAHMTPEMLGLCGILPMRNVQLSRELATESAVCEVTKAELIFLRMKNRIVNEHSADIAAKVQTAFLKMAPSVVSYVYGLKNNIFSEEATFRMVGGESIMSDYLPAKSIEFLIDYLKDGGNDGNDSDKSIADYMAYALFTVFSSVLDAASTSTFDGWIRNMFEIAVPDDWVAFDVPSHFWDVFPRPCLQAMRHVYGSLAPLDCELLLHAPIVDERCHFPTPQSVAVCTSLFLQVFNQAKVMMRSNQNMFIYGPRQSGKTSFLAFMFKSIPNTIPVTIPVGAMTTAVMLYEFLKRHTDILRKDYVHVSDRKRYALVFDNIDPSHTAAIEFIRMITNGSRIPVISSKDPKILEFVEIHNYFVVVTATSMKEFPSRFISRFTPMQILQPTVGTMRHVFMKTASVFKVSEKITEKVVELYETMSPSFSIMRLLDVMMHVEQRICVTEDETELMMRTVLTELNLLLFHNETVEQTKIDYRGDFASVFPSLAGERIMSDFVEGNVIYSPEITYNATERKISVKVQPQQRRLLHEELSFHYSSFNRKLHEKALILFTTPVIENIVLLARAISYPGSTVFAKGLSGTGRRTLVRFVSAMKDYDYVDLPTKALTESQAKFAITTLMERISSTQKPTVLHLRVGAENRVMTDIVLGLIRNFDFMPFFSDVGLDSLYTRMAKANDLLRDVGPYGNFVDVLHGLRICIRFVVSVDDAFCDDEYTGSYCIRFCEGKDHWERIACDILARAGITDNILPAAFKTVHCRVMPGFCRVHQNHYIDMINMFLEYSKADNADLLIRNENAEMGIQFISRLQELKDDLKSQMETLLPEISDVENVVGEKSAAHRSKVDAVNARVARCAEERKRMEDEIAEINKDIEADNEFFADDMVQLSKAKATMEAMKNEDIYEIQNLADPPKPMKKIITGFCLFLRLAPSFKKGGKDLLVSVDFLDLVRNIDYQAVTPVMTGKVVKLFSQYPFDPEEIAAISPYLLRLYNYLASLHTYCARADKLNKSRVSMERKMREFDKYIQDTSAETESIASVGKTLNEEKGDVEEMETSLKDLVGRKLELERRLVKVDKALENVDAFKKVLETTINNLDALKLKCIGNAILMSVYLVYCGAMDKEVVTLSLLQTQKVLKSMFVSVTEEEAISYVQHKASLLDKTEKALRIDRYLSQDTENDLRRLRLTVRTPLIMDYDGHVLTYLRDATKKSVVEVSLHDDNITAAMVDAMREGRTMIVYDANMMTDLLQEVLPLDLVCDDERIANTVKVGNVTMARHIKFKLFLVTSFRFPDMIPEDLRARTNVFICSENLSVSKKLYSIFMPKFAPDVRYESTDILANETILARITLERELIDLMAECMSLWNDDESYDILMDEETAGDMVRTKERYYDNLCISFDADEMPDAFAKFSPSISVCVAFWKALTRYLPRITHVMHFSLDDFLESIKRSVDWLAADREEKFIHRAICEAVVQFIVPMLGCRESFFVMFMTAFLLKHQERKCDMSTLDMIIEHCHSQLTDVCDSNVYDMLTGDPIDQLKFANIANLFSFMSRVIADLFGENFENYFQPTKMNCFILEQPGKLLVVRSARNVWPVHMLMKFVESQTALDRVNSYSLIDDEAHIKIVKQKIANAGPKWIFLHCTTMSPRIAETLNFLAKSCNPEKHDFRLVVFTDSLAKMPQSVLTAKYVMFDGFPSLKHQMGHIQEQFHMLIRSNINSVAMRKMSYIGAMVISALNFRSFFTPLGLCDHGRIPDVLMHDIIGYINTLLEMKLRAIHIRNFCDVICRIAIGSGACDRFDLERMIATVTNMIKPQLLDIDYVVAETDWRVPSDVFRTNDLPVFASGNVLFMDSGVSAAVRNWNMSRYFVSTVAAMRKSPAFNRGDAEKIAENALVTLPNVITTDTEALFGSITRMFLLGEIDRFNNVLTVMREQIMRREDAILHSVGESETPLVWRDMLGYCEASNFTKFLSHLRDRSFLLNVWKKGNFTPKAINICLVTNIRGMFHSIIAEEAWRMEKPVDELELRFTILPNSNAVKEGIVISGTYLVGARFDFEGQTLVQSKTPFTKIHSLLCEVVPKETTEGVFRCPIFRSLPARDFIGKGGHERIDGESENFITYAQVPSDVSDWKHVCNSTSIVCHMSEYFS